MRALTLLRQSHGLFEADWNWERVELHYRANDEKRVVYDMQGRIPS